jgi:hypothetical protein
MDEQAGLQKVCKKQPDSSLYVKLLRTGRLFFRDFLLSRSGLPKTAAPLGFAARAAASGPAGGSF